MKGTFSRFIAIAAIVALGVGLLSGLMAMPIDMRTTIDEYFDRQNMHDLRIVSPLGLTDDDVAAIAAVDGFMPRRDAFEVISTEEDRERIMNEERRLFCNSVSKASKRLVVSYFSKAPLELAERAKMQVVRVKAEGNGRVASVRPTAFLAEAGNAAPVTTGGQALLAQHGLN